ncbi:MAG: hypothetical protein ACYC2G_06930 [Gemmatimonadaceae bacterium]
MRHDPVISHGGVTRVGDAELNATLATLNARAWGISVGLLMGVGLFIATNVLVLRGGETVGPHLGLLAVFLPGYRVTFLGSLVGFVYAFVIGYGMGRLVGTVYNALARR